MKRPMRRGLALGSSRRNLGGGRSSSVPARGQSGMIPSPSAVAGAAQYREMFPGQWPYASPASGMIGSGGMIQGPAGASTRRVGGASARVLSYASGMIGSGGMI